MAKKIPKVVLGVAAIAVMAIALLIVYKKMTITKAPEKTAIVEDAIVAKPMLSDYELPPIKDGMVPVITHIPTAKKVVFLTIDDGTHKNQSEIDTLAANNIKASLFLTKTSITTYPEFFKPIQDQGSLIENHTMLHNPMMYKRSYDSQKADICGMSDYITEQYGRRPILFRPPGGAYSDTTLKAIADCGMKAAVTWIALVEKGTMKYQVDTKLRPGDIVLMHFTSNFDSDINAFIKAAKASELEPVLLEDFLQVKS